MNDIIDFLEEEEDHTFDQYLIENEAIDEIRLNLISLDSNYFDNEYGTETKIYDDAVKMIKEKFKDFILDSQAYYHLAERII
ncbi:hypothetical protein [Paenibacillus glacialis]|uniref:Uncharacterized protein n=1 Tax=Paenibacillus glacialis TaxID=494026 RepID=A0A168M3K2_9BACL|nr:hypothetical protein [Paenibacillus glacialis]OAB44178.1 hypothetical protein PGLA_05775 [Paenibacillus glacialis]